MGHFENDGAGDLLADMGTSFSSNIALEALKACLVPSEDYLEAPEAQRAIAAAALVRHLLAGAGNVQIENRSVAFGDLPAGSPEKGALRQASVGALTRSLDRNSEIQQLWEESARFSEWSAGIERLRAELSKAG